MKMSATPNLLFAFLLGTLWLWSAVAAAAGFAVDVDENGLALKGYDAVAYFVEGRPTKGDKQYSAALDDAVYYFASAENRERFLRDPQRYRPAYGGYCAYGVTLRIKVTGDPIAWKIVDGVLYINSSLDSRAEWSKDIPGYIHKADRIWPSIRDMDPAKL